MSDKLKSCPFCGSKANQGRWHDELPELVECSGCSAQCSDADDWNERVGYLNEISRLNVQLATDLRVMQAMDEQIEQLKGELAAAKDGRFTVDWHEFWDSLREIDRYDGLPGPPSLSQPIRRLRKALQCTDRSQVIETPYRGFVASPEEIREGRKAHPDDSRATYACGCEAAGSLVGRYCPIHGEPSK